MSVSSQDDDAAPSAADASPQQDTSARERSGASRHGGADLDLGHEPPLDTSGGSAAEIDRRGVNVRWLGASVLTALTGAALLGTAIYVALQGDTTFAEFPERYIAAEQPRGASDETTVHRGDKLVRTEMTVSAKQSFKAPMTTRVGDREVIRVRTFTRIATTLSQTSGVYASNIPPFNPQRLFAEDGEDRSAEPSPADVADADVSFTRRDLASLTIAPGAPALGDQDVAAQIEEERRLLAETGRRPSIPLPAQLLLTRTLRQPSEVPDAASAYAGVVDAPFNSIEVRVVPENVTTLAKADPRVTDPLVEEHTAQIRRGETLETVLKTFPSTPEQIRGLIGALGGPAKVAQLPEGQQMRVLVAPGLRPGDRRQILRVILYGENGIEAIAAANDRGGFVAVSPPMEENRKAVAKLRSKPDAEEDEEGGGVPLYNSLYETALKHDLPRQTVDDLVRIFGYDVDFQRRVGSGDSFEIFLTSEDEGSDRPEVLMAALTIGGEVRRVYRFQSEEGTDYFDDAGRSLKKFLLRKPISEGELRSGFGYRRHPILGYAKMHTGVDWANRIGTPILAAGNGSVVKAEWDGGYGRRVEIQHTNGYVTAYNHMSRFAKGVSAGAKVRQGQVIGYVGNTGLSTGPHLHYEVIVNGHFVDPLKIRVPRGRELDGRALAEFKRQREQVDGLIEKAGASRYAQRDTR